MAKIIGSPPHTRGTVSFNACLKASIRITPAYAGNRAMQKFNFKCQKDHPRIRGEQQAFGLYVFGILGSPPHTRGTVFPLRIAPSAIRITPAYAGNSYNKPFLFYLYQDHPRIRGEQMLHFMLSWLLAGSPPHTRGTD